MDNAELEELLAKTMQAQMGEAATYAGGQPHLNPRLIETFMRTSYGYLMDIDFPTCWVRFMLYVSNPATYMVALIDMKEEPQHSKHFDWMTELSISSANMRTDQISTMLTRFGTLGVTKYSPESIVGMRSMLKHKDKTLEDIAHTIVYRGKKAAVAWTRDDDTGKGLEIAGRMGLDMESRDGIKVAVLRARKKAK